MQWMSEASAATFQKEVVERSARQLVLVDFWAPWCQPCKVLGPILEAAVEARGGQAWLVKVNTDDEQALALQYRVQGIPAVKAFLGARLVDEFVGVRDRRFVEAFLLRLLPSAEEQALQQAELLLKRNEPDRAAAALTPALESPRHRDDALLLLARSQMARGAFAEASRTLAEIATESLAGPAAELLGARLELLSAADGVDVETLSRAVAERPEDADARWRLAARFLAQGDANNALEQLLELLQRDRSYRNDGPRRAMLSILDELGPEHDLAREFRRRMQVYL